MFSFLRENNNADGTAGPLSMRRLAAALCLLSSIGAAVFALIIISKAVANNGASPSSFDWKVFVPVFIPCLSFLLGSIIFLLFTTWEGIKEVVSAASGLKKN